MPVILGLLGSVIAGFAGEYIYDKTLGAKKEETAQELADRQGAYWANYNRSIQIRKAFVIAGASMAIIYAYKKYIKR
jgi:hypothetical protein